MKKVIRQFATQYTNNTNNIDEGMEDGSTLSRAKYVNIKKAPQQVEVCVRLCCQIIYFRRHSTPFGWVDAPTGGTKWRKQATSCVTPVGSGLPAVTLTLPTACIFSILRT